MISGSKPSPRAMRRFFPTVDRRACRTRKENDFLKVMILVLVLVDWIGELRVGEDSTDPGDVDEQGVEDLSFVLVLIEAQINVGSRR